ncbi:hypothetical protein J1N35_044170 [Gossypium stocksii]|uniref:Uncharacterized protein n=1 Tax=Gossypium stocksii TaxID=47602 RepID=A0A9D3U902_9ROSI|nr:hypothetical protein J1N35_044170 [Gossypium stocksii]
MERGMENLSIDNGEEDMWSVAGEEETQKSVYGLCLVGCCLTVSVVHFPAMRNTMVNLRHPLRGVQSSDLGEKAIFSSFSMRWILPFFLFDSTTKEKRYNKGGISLCVRHREGHVLTIVFGSKRKEMVDFMGKICEGKI